MKVAISIALLTAANCLTPIITSTCDHRHRYA